MRRFFLALLFVPILAQAATVVSLGSTFNTTAGNKTVTATPTASDLIVVVAAASGANNNNAATTNVSDNQSGTYTMIIESAAGTSPRISIWVRDALVPSATSTIYTATQANSNGGGLHVFRVTSMSRTGGLADRGFGTNFSDTAGTTPSVTLQQAADTNNALIGGVVNGTNPAGVTQPGSWAENLDTGYATPATGLETVSRNSGETNTTITWASTSATAWRAVVVELDITVPPSGSGGMMGFWP